MSVYSKDLNQFFCKKKDRFYANIIFSTIFSIRNKITKFACAAVFIVSFVLIATQIFAKNTQINDNGAWIAGAQIPGILKKVKLLDDAALRKLLPAGDFYYSISWSEIVEAGVARLSFRHNKAGLKNAKDLQERAEASERINLDSEIFEFASSGRSSSLARLLWSFDYWYQGKFTGTAFLDGMATMAMRQGDGADFLRNRYRRGDGVFGEKITRTPGGRAVSHQPLRFAFADAFSLASAVAFLRRVDFEAMGAEQAAFVIFPQDAGYMLSLGFAGKERRKYAWGETNTLRLDMKLLRVKGKNANKLRDYDKFENASVWLSDDEYRMPTEIRTKIFIGEVVCVLKRREKSLDNDEKADYFREVEKQAHEIFKSGNFKDKK